jgi:hypothetical protein
MVSGKSGGVQGHCMSHTKRFHRTLAGFGLTWHGGGRVSCFLEILETHFITKYLQIGHPTRAPRADHCVIMSEWFVGLGLRFRLGVGLVSGFGRGHG